MSKSFAEFFNELASKSGMSGGAPKNNNNGAPPEDPHTTGGGRPATATATNDNHSSVPTFNGGSLDTFLNQFNHLTTSEVGTSIVKKEQAGAAGAAADKKNHRLKKKADLARSKVDEQIKEHREGLPIFNFRDQFIQMMRDHQTVVVIGETGCGKSTQLPQYLYEARFADAAKIGCTQPRRVAAKSLATQVAKECKTQIGDLVGYRIRFEDKTAPHTVITYMTDGVLLNHFYSDPNLDTYSVIMLDEAHERSINTDVLFGLLKSLLARRKDLKLIITSATLNAGKFAQYFKAPLLEVYGRAFPVEIIYSPFSDYLSASVRQVMQIHLREPPGDVLVFLPGQDEIESASDLLYESYLTEKSSRPVSTDEMKIIPCYAALPWEEQQEIFEPAPPNTRKVIIATNIAETSLTVENIVYVVDSGVMKQTQYNPKSGVSTLVILPITKSQAKQRAGRAGRTKPGKVFRMYNVATFDKMSITQIPEIQRANVESVVLQLAAIGIRDIVLFDYMDSPTQESIGSAIIALKDLQALDNYGQLTMIGRKMAGFPLAPNLAKILIASAAEFGCSEEILTIVAMLSTQSQNFFFRPKKQKLLADTKIATFFHPLGDHFTLLNLYKAWRLQQKSPVWSKSNFVQQRSMEEADDIRKQLANLLDSHYLPRVSCGLQVDKIQKTLCSGFFSKVAQKGHRYNYKIIGEKRVDGGAEEIFIHPSSSLFKKNPPWLIYHEVLKTKRPYMRQVVSIQPDWIRQYAPQFFQRHFTGSVAGTQLR